MRFGLTLLLILFLAPQVGAQEALLELIQGRLKVQRGTQVRFLTNDDPDNPLRVELQKNTRVQTGANSQALVTLRRGEEVIQLRSNSLFSLDQLGEEETQIRMPVGKAQFRVDPNRRIKRRFVVRTPTAVVGVKGTEFVMGAGDGATSMLTLSGTVEMASAEAISLEPWRWPLLKPLRSRLPSVRGRRPNLRSVAPPLPLSPFLRSCRPALWKVILQKPLLL